MRDLLDDLGAFAAFVLSASSFAAWIVVLS